MNFFENHIPKERWFAQAYAKAVAANKRAQRLARLGTRADVGLERAQMPQLKSSDMANIFAGSLVISSP